MIPLLSIRFFSPRSGRFSAALLVSTALVMLCFLLLHLLPLLGSGDIVGDECIHSELSDSLPFGSSWVVVVLVSGSGVLHCGLVILFTSLHSCNLTIGFSG